MPAFETEDHCRIYYETYGFDNDRTSIVFLNGTTQTTINWLPLAKELKSRFRIVLYDARGQGKSSLGQKDLSIDHHVDDLARLLKILEIEKTNLVGLSHGAQVACAFTARYAPKVLKLILCSLGAEKDPFALAVITAWQKTLAAGGIEAMAWASLPIIFGRQYLGAHRSWLDKMVAAMVSRNQKNYLAAHLNAMRHYPAPSHFAAQIRSRCLVLNGTEDPLVTVQNAKRLADMVSGRHVQFPDTGHSVPAEAPEAFKSSLLEFLG